MNETFATEVLREHLPRVSSIRRIVIGRDAIMQQLKRPLSGSCSMSPAADGRLVRSRKGPHEEGFEGEGLVTTDHMGHYDLRFWQRLWPRHAGLSGLKLFT